MERYETARIDVTQIEEDVITASAKQVAYCTDIEGGPHDDSYIDHWVVFYSDDTHEEIPGSDKPSICP